MARGNENWRRARVARDVERVLGEAQQEAGAGLANRIEDVEQAMKDRYSSGGTLGLGLPGVRRLMDVFRLESVPGQGTRVVAAKLQ